MVKGFPPHLVDIMRLPYKEKRRLPATATPVPVAGALISAVLTVVKLCPSSHELALPRDRLATLLAPPEGLSTGSGEALLQ